MVKQFSTSAQDWRLFRIGVSLIWFPLLVGAGLALALFLLSLVPFYLEGPRVRQYATLSEAAKDMGMAILWPSSLPEPLSGTVASIRGQWRPVPIVTLVFRAEDGREFLRVYQALSSGERPPFPVLESEAKTGVDLDGQRALLASGRRNGHPYYELYWRKDGRHILIAGFYSPEELRQIARSLNP